MGFLGGNRLPQRWQGKPRFVVLETGFGLGNNFLATWQAWRDDPQRCAQLHFISIEKHPLSRADLRAAHADSAWPDLAQILIDAWPPLTPDLHSLSFEGGKVELLLALGDVQAWLPQLVAQVDAFYLDGFAPAHNPEMWAPQVFKALARLAASAATLSTRSVAKSIDEGLRAAGFRVEPAQRIGSKRQMTLATLDPVFTPRRAVARTGAAAPAQRHAVIVGAGLAGCATAWALARQGWTSTLLERRGSVAEEASGNLAGAFHGIVNPEDGAHARFNRAAALHAQRVIAPAVQHGGVAGNVSGLLRLEPATRDLKELRATLRALGLPEDYVAVLDAEQTARRAGVPLRRAALFYPGGGCVDPGALARHFLRCSGAACTLRADAHVTRIRREAGLWRVFDANDALIEAASTLILCNAGDATRLLGQPDWPLDSVRGQVSMLPVAALPQGTALPQLAITGEGFLLPEMQGRIVFGATASNGDFDARVRESDQQLNLARLAQLWPLAQLRPEAALAGLPGLQGRVGWRCSASDRLPLIGAVPLVLAAGATYPDQPRRITREPGLHVFIGLGSRGITWCALGASLLASLVAGAPAPLPASLIDAVDPARFAARRARKARKVDATAEAVNEAEVGAAGAARTDHDAGGGAPGADASVCG